MGHTASTGRRSLIAGVALAACLAACAPRSPESAEDRPNVVLIVADDVGYEAIGAYGSRHYRTPRLDALAREGARFDYCFSTPLCTPSRVQLMTGRYAHRNYVGFGILSRDERTFAHLMKQAGYVTFAAGKWQLGPLRGPRGDGTSTRARGTTPEQAGFDEWCLWSPRSYHGRYWQPSVRTERGVVETSQQDYGPDIWSHAITGFMRQHREHPFFVYYPMVLAHDPFLPPPGHPNADADADPSADWRSLDRPEHYPDMVAYADKLVGRIVDTLEELGLRERTLLLFTADNGALDAIRSPLDGVTVRGGKGEMTDAGTHVPLIASWQGVTPPGTVSEDLVDFSDFYATLADVVGARLEPGSGIDGVSFLPRLKGEAASSREWAFMFYPGSPSLESPGGYWARTRRFKLYGDGRLFDLESDPLEARPVEADADTTDSAPERRRLQRVFEQLEVASSRVPVVRR